MFPSKASCDISHNIDLGILKCDVFGSVVGFTSWRGFKTAGNNWALRKVAARIDEVWSCLLQHNRSGWVAVVQFDSFNITNTKLFTAIKFSCFPNLCNVFRFFIYERSLSIFQSILEKADVVWSIGVNLSSEAVQNHVRK